jgi:hypothetical protein
MESLKASLDAIEKERFTPTPGEKPKQKDHAG